MVGSACTEGLETMKKYLFVQLELGMLKSMAWFIVYTPQRHQLIPNSFST